MGKTFYSKRLPKGLCIFLNNFGEYLVCSGEGIVQIEGKNVKAGKTLKEAIENYLDRKTQGRYF